MSGWPEYHSIFSEELTTLSPLRAERGKNWNSIGVNLSEKDK